MKNFIVLVGTVCLFGCSAAGGVGTGALTNILGAAQTGGNLTPLENIATQYILQRLQDDHNLLVGANLINQATGMVSITTPPPVMTQTGPGVVMPTVPVTVVPTGSVVTVVPPAPVPTPAPVPVQ